MAPLVYAGIGARKTPKPVLAVMRRMAWYLVEKGWHLNTGGADGADRAFVDGSPVLRTVFLPWPGYNGWRGPDCVTYTEESLDFLSSIAARHHPAWERCSPAVRKLHARNVAVVFGARASGITPTRAVVCWTEGGRVTGGTGVAIRLAEAAQIPVFNLATMHPRDVCLAMNRIAQAGRARRRERADRSPYGRLRATPNVHALLAAGVSVPHVLAPSTHAARGSSASLRPLTR